MCEWYTVFLSDLTSLCITLSRLIYALFDSISFFSMAGVIFEKLETKTYGYQAGKEELEIKFNIYTLIYIQYSNNENLLYSTEIYLMLG